MVLPPSGKVARPMEKCLDGDPVRRDLIDQAIPEHKQFAFGWVVEFRNHPPSFGQRTQGRGGLERLLQNLKSPVARILSDVLNDLVETGTCGFSPDYRASPSSHLRRISASTCS